MDINISQPDKKIYECDLCHIKTNNKKDYNNHLLTKKHTKNSQGFKIPNKLICECGKKYNYSSGLYKHAKKCTYSSKALPNEVLPAVPQDMSFLTNLVLEVVKTNTELQNQNNTELINDNKDLKNLILEMMKSNTDLQKQMLEVCKNTNNTNNNTIHNNSHNKTFNLQFFLNEQCKDAMNIMDFVNSVTLQLSDLESVGQLGYVEGITKIMIKKLTEMDIYKRPEHCSDAKREIIHVKDNDVWAKEEETYPKLRRAIKYITKKNSDLLLAWSAKYPESKNIYSKVNETYLIMLQQAMGGSGEVTENENKIIKKISKMILIDK
jgi:hypothetical protein